MSIRKEPRMTFMTEALFEETVAARRYLHEHPEIGFELENTVSFVRNKLDACGIPHTDRYGQCSVCGYLYDPAEHDGVAFEDLPDDWRCPRCKQPKTKFNKA